MPVYTFYDKKKKKEFTVTMSMSERETYLKDNPQIEQRIVSMHISDPFSVGVTRPDAAFQKHIIGRMKDKIPGNNLSRSRFNIPREV